MGHRESRSRLLWLAAFFFPTVAAQQVGVDLCACQPAVYSLRLQLNLTCSDDTVVAGLPGIRDTTCIVDKSSDMNVTDFTPALINEIQFLETDQEGNIVRQILLADGYVDGDVVEYTSFLLGESSDINAVSLPSGFSVFVTAQNAAGQPILQTWAIEFSNDCTVHPVLTVGQSIGWTVFSELQDPPVVPLLCPLVSAMPSEFPSGVPVLERTMAPVSVPSLGPIAVTTPAPVVAPTATVGPIATPTVTVPPLVPVEPTMSPMAQRTPAPVVAPTVTVGPIATPAVTVPPLVPVEPTMSPMAQRTPAPVVVPSAAPILTTQRPAAERTPAPAVVPPAAPVLTTPSPMAERTPSPVVATVPTTAPIMSPNAEKTPAPSCELSGKRQPNKPELSAPVGKRRPERHESTRKRRKPNRDNDSSDASSPRVRKRNRRRPKPSLKDSAEASSGKRRGSDHDNSTKRRLHVGPHAPYAYPSGCPEPLP